MRCLVCERWSFSHLCRRCQDTYIVPNPVVKELDCGLKVLSFFAYDEIDFLLKSKHKDLGFYMYNILAKKTMPSFAKAFNYQTPINILPIDDTAVSGYSHTAILAKRLQSSTLIPLFRTLRARNKINYSGQSLAFRLANPRDFKVLKKVQHDVILVDDVVTTGTTLCEAKEALAKEDISTLMAVVLADASR